MLKSLCRCFSIGQAPPRLPPGGWKDDLAARPVVALPQNPPEKGGPWGREQRVCMLYSLLVMGYVAKCEGFSYFQRVVDRETHLV